MECPKCNEDEMDKVMEGITTVERCRHCYGLYFEQLTQEIVPLLVGKEQVDSGSDELGSTFDDMVYVDCPKCDKIMDQRMIEDPVYIRFEHCPTCKATFLDAGELRQYLAPDYVSEFKALLPEE